MSLSKMPVECFTASPISLPLARAVNFARLVGVWSMKFNIPRGPGDTVVDVFWGDNEKIEAELLDFLIGMVTKMNRKCKATAFADVCKELAGILKDRKLNNEDVKMLNDFEDLINSLSPSVTRISDGELPDALVKFNDNLLAVQKSNPSGHLLTDDSLYFGAYVPEDVRGEFGSDHITVGWGQMAKKIYFSTVGTEVTVTPAKEVVAWETAGHDKYAYLPMLIRFADGSEIASHNSHHIEGGGKSYKLNHVYQRESGEVVKWDTDKAFRSLILVFDSRNSDRSYHGEFDFDKTLVIEAMTHSPDGVFDPNLLHDPTTLQPKFISSLGKLIDEMKLPFRVVTARTGIKYRNELEAEIKKLFPHCVEVSWGKSIKCPPGEMRDRMKSDNKLSRFTRGVWGFDDERCVVENRGYGTVVNKDFSLTHFHSDDLPSTHTAFSLMGPTGAGKTTLIEKFITRTGAVSIIDDDGVSPLVVVASADGSDPDHLTLPYERFASSYPGRRTTFMFDTTGDGRKNMPFPSFILSPHQTGRTMVGCLIGMMARNNHANLNGYHDIDLASYKVDRNTWNTNHLNLSEFINYQWFLRGKSQVALRDVFVRLGQSATFTESGGELSLLTSYREGMQFWNAVWGRQNRKCVHILDGGKWCMVKSGLECGAEMKPITHTDEGDSYNKRLDPFQVQVCKILFEGKNFLAEGSRGWYLTQKKDGSLIQITRIVKNIGANTRYVDGSGNEFVKMLKKASLREDGSFLVISTNGTFLASEHMWGYIVTAIASDYKFNLGDTGVLEAWNMLLEMVCERTYAIFDHYSFTENATFGFEAVCPNRSAFGVVHTELAVSYKTGGFYFLGIRVGERYIPHFEVPVLGESGVSQPLYWLIEDTTVILKMLTAVQRISCDEDYSDADFLADYPSTGGDGDVVDHEGFVLLVPTLEPKQWDYGKMKTLLYYMFHKVHERNMEQITALAMSTDLSHFPIAKVIKDTVNSLADVDWGRLNDIIDPILEKYAPVAPAEGEKNRKILGVYKAHITKKEKYTVDKTDQEWRKFMYGNRPAGMAEEVYSVMMVELGANYIVEQYLPLLGGNKREMSKTELQHQNIIVNSVSVISGAVQTVSPSKIEEVLRKHISYIRIQLPV